MSARELSALLHDAERHGAATHSRRQERHAGPLQRQPHVAPAVQALIELAPHVPISARRKYPLLLPLSATDPASLGQRPPFALPPGDLPILMCIAEQQQQQQEEKENEGQKKEQNESGEQEQEGQELPFAMSMDMEMDPARSLCSSPSPFPSAAPAVLPYFTNLPPLDAPKPHARCGCCFDVDGSILFSFGAPPGQLVYHRSECSNATPELTARPRVL